jgi:hypothetical protein
MLLRINKLRQTCDTPQIISGFHAPAWGPNGGACFVPDGVCNPVPRTRDFNIVISTKGEIFAWEPNDQRLRINSESQSSSHLKVTKHLSLVPMRLRGNQTAGPLCRTGFARSGLMDMVANSMPLSLSLRR